MIFEVFYVHDGGTLPINFFSSQYLKNNFSIFRPAAWIEALQMDDIATVENYNHTWCRYVCGIHSSSVSFTPSPLLKHVPRQGVKGHYFYHIVFYNWKVSFTLPVKTRTLITLWGPAAARTLKPQVASTRNQGGKGTLSPPGRKINVVFSIFGVKRPDFVGI